MKKINIDMWHGDKPEDADRISVSFSDMDCEYRGNIYKNGKAIGDYSANDSLEIQKAFPQLVFNWN